MEKKNIFLGKIHKNGCYVNDGKYGYFLTCDKKNYKIPEWLPHEKMDLETVYPARGVLVVDGSIALTHLFPLRARRILKWHGVL